MRNLYTIAAEIKNDWKNVNYAAKPYLEAMTEITSIHDKYYEDTAAAVVMYFLANAGGWRGETAKRIKAELNAQLKTTE